MITRLKEGAQAYVAYTGILTAVKARAAASLRAMNPELSHFFRLIQALKAVQAGPVRQNV